MPKLPRVSGKRAIAALERQGFAQVRSRGSHVVMARSRPDAGRVVCVVPAHDEIAVGTLRGVLRRRPASKLMVATRGRREPPRSWSTRYRDGVERLNLGGSVSLMLLVVPRSSSRSARLSARCSTDSVASWSTRTRALRL
jgi:predicted RNA binding protein YcfA (HicA-like mRNA interferase family)